MAAAKGLVTLTQGSELGPAGGDCVPSHMATFQSEAHSPSSAWDIMLYYAIEGTRKKRVTFSAGLCSQIRFHLRLHRETVLCRGGSAQRELARHPGCIEP